MRWTIDWNRILEVCKLIFRTHQRSSAMINLAHLRDRHWNRVSAIFYSTHFYSTAVFRHKLSPIANLIKIQTIKCVWCTAIDWLWHERLNLHTRLHAQKHTHTPTFMWCVSQIEWIRKRSKQQQICTTLSQRDSRILS